MVQVSPKKSLSWEIAVPLVSNKDILAQTTVACSLTWVLTSCLMGFILLVQGELDSLASILLMMAGVSLALWLLMLIIMLVLFKNRLPMHFTVNHQGVTAAMMSPIGKKANRLAIILGLISGKLGTAGSGLMAMAQETVSYHWKEIAQVKFDAQRQVITIFNSWRPLVYIYSTKADYPTLVKLVRTYHRQKNLVNPLPQLLLHTVLIFLACLPLFKLDYPFELDLFLLILLLCFAQASLWLIPFFGYIVIAVIGLIILTLIGQGLTTHQSMYDFMADYTGFGILNSDDWLGLMIVAVGLIYLCYLSWRLITGKQKSALFND